MIIAGLGRVVDNTDSLVSLLAEPKKALDAVKALKAENVKLAKAKKELIGAKSLKAFCEEQEDRAAAAIEAQRRDLEIVKAEERSIIDETKKENKKLATTIGKLNTLKKELDEQEKELFEFNCELDKDSERLAKFQAETKDRMEHALSLKEQYEDKLNDIKARLKGL